MTYAIKNRRGFYFTGVTGRWSEHLSLAARWKTLEGVSLALSQMIEPGTICRVVPTGSESGG